MLVVKLVYQNSKQSDRQYANWRRLSSSIDRSDIIAKKKSYIVLNSHGFAKWLYSLNAKPSLKKVTQYRLISYQKGSKMKVLIAADSTDDDKIDEIERKISSI